MKKESLPDRIIDHLKNFELCEKLLKEFELEYQRDSSKELKKFKSSKQKRSSSR